MPDTIPNTWDYKRPITAHKSVLVFEPYFGPRQTRTFGDGSPEHAWEIGNDDTDRDSFIEQKAFWDDHFPGVSVFLYDPQLDEHRTYEIDSDFNFAYGAGESYAWSYKIKEVYPYTPIAGPPP